MSDYQDAGPSIVGVSLSLVILASILVIIRTAYRFKSHAFGVDDAFLIAAVTLSISHSVVDCISVYQWGYGKHKADLTPAQATAPGQSLGFWIAQLMYKLVIPFTKLSICLLYRRLFERAGRTFKIALHSIAGLIVLYYSAAFLTTIFECTPVQKSWQKTLPGTCINTATFFFVNAGFNIATDVAIMLLPVPVIYSLHLPMRQRIVLCFVFAIGIIATTTSIVRIFTLNVSIQSVDPTWEIGQSTLWSSAEMNTAIICACIPVLKAPLQAIFPRMFSAASRSRSAVQAYYAGNNGSRVPRSAPSKISRFSAHRGSIPMDTMEKRLNGRNSERTIMEDNSDDEVYILQGTNSSHVRATSEGRAILKSMDIDVTFEDRDKADTSTSSSPPRVGKAF